MPGLVLAELWPDTDFVLLEADPKRAGFLDNAVLELGWGDRVRVVCDRAESVGHGELRASFDLVSSRSFGRPAVVAECAAPFLRVGGVLAVSEPPEDTDRWPAQSLDELAMSVVGATGHVMVLKQERLCPDQYARGPGVPQRRPLW